MSEDLQSLASSIRSGLKPGDRVVLVTGDFNIIHPGHLRILNFAASLAEFLVVAVNADSQSESFVPEQMRCDGIAALGIVGRAVILRVPPEDFIRVLQPDYVVKGHEYSEIVNVEQEAVESYGGKLVFGSGDVRFSSRDLIRQEFHSANFVTLRQPTDYPQRHGFHAKDLIDVVHRFAGLKVVVIGDLIVDEYIDCEPLGMSREDPTIVVMPVNSERFVGGAGIVAAHAKGLGAEVCYFGVASDDPVARWASDKLAEYGVTSILAMDKTRPTTIKQRYRASNKTLLRVSHLRQHEISADIVDAIFNQMAAHLKTADLLIFSDFNYGCLPQALVDRLRAFCIAYRIPMVADSQASSQVGDVSRFEDCLLITPTEHEARLAVRDFQSGLVALADSLLKKARARHILLTLAAEGVLVHDPSNPNAIITDRLPAFNPTPRDVSGAGDSMFTSAAMALTLGSSLWSAAYLGSIAAACQVGRIGNTPLTAAELIRELSV